MDKYGNTPLHVAAKYGHELLISTLMTNGADTARYQKLCDLADNLLLLLNGIVKVYILTGIEQCEGLSVVIFNLYVFMTRFHFLRRGIHGMFPLHLAVLYGFSDCCRKLLSSGL